MKIPTRKSRIALRPATLDVWFDSGPNQNRDSQMAMLYTVTNDAPPSHSKLRASVYFLEKIDPLKAFQSHSCLM
jgi:hypothetical protein